jgi:EAL domain-containing protein (putative c-di-GMP-specific phosphodiesterase class I)
MRYASRCACPQAPVEKSHELGKQTIAEQVETEAELTCLKNMGVDFVQGYLLHRPAPLPVN